jgi:hypothetical protein
MRNALRVLVAVACWALPIAAFGGNYYYPPTAYPYSHQPAPVPQLFYAPPVVRTTMVGYGSHGGYGGCCAPQPTPSCCYRPPSNCCGYGSHGYGGHGGYGYGGYGGYGGASFSAGITLGHYGHHGQHHHHFRPPHRPVPHPHPPRHSQSVPKAAPQPQYAAPHYVYAQQPVQAAYAPYYAGQPYYAYPQHAAPQTARIAAAPRPKPTGLRGVSKPLPPVKDEAVAKNASTGQVAGIPQKVEQRSEK